MNMPSQRLIEQWAEEVTTTGDLVHAMILHVAKKAIEWDRAHRKASMTEAFARVNWQSDDHKDAAIDAQHMLDHRQGDAVDRNLAACYLQAREVLEVSRG